MLSSGQARDEALKARAATSPAPLHVPLSQLENVRRA
jgi:hypothetical protein